MFRTFKRWFLKRPQNSKKITHTFDVWWWWRRQNIWNFFFKLCGRFIKHSLYCIYTLLYDQIHYIIDMKVCFSHPVQFDLQKSKKKCRVGVSYRQCTWWWWFYSCKYIFVCSTYLTFMIIYCIYSSWSYLNIVI